MIGGPEPIQLVYTRISDLIYILADGYCPSGTGEMIITTIIQRGREGERERKVRIKRNNEAVLAGS